MNMKMTKRLIVTLLALVMCFSMMQFPSVASEAEAEEASETVTEDIVTVIPDLSDGDIEELVSDILPAAGEDVTVSEAAAEAMEDEESADETAETAETEEVQSQEEEISQTPAVEEIPEEPQTEEAVESETVQESSQAEDDITVFSEEETTEEKAAEVQEVTREVAPNAALASPVISKIAPNDEGLVISWNEVSGADGYIVYRRLASESSWTRIGSSKTASYTDITPAGGESYYYTVKAYIVNNKKYTYSGYLNPGSYYHYLTIPRPMAGNTADGVRISWNAVKDAASYKVFRRVAKGNYSVIAEVNTNSYVDTTAVPGIDYIYTVRAYVTDSGTTCSSYFYKSGAKGSFLPIPESVKVTEAAKGLHITWSAVAYATGYRIMRKAEGGNWQNLKDVGAVTSYDDASGVSGTTYYYSVRAIRKVSSGTYLSNYDKTGVKKYYLAIPQLNGTAVKSEYLNVSWDKVTGADYYTVYRKTEGSSKWDTLAEEVTGTSYKDTTAKDGVGYIYTVRAYHKDGDGTVWRSHFKSAGAAGYRISSPNVIKIDNATKGLKITWETIADASGYYVYRKQAGASSWKAIATINKAATVTYTDTSAADNVTYTYCVRAFRKVGTQAAVSPRNDGMSQTRLGRPTSVTVKKASSGFTVTWKAVPNAEKYQIMRKLVGTTAWAVIGETKSTNYSDPSASQTNDYCYFVIAYNSTGRGDHSDEAYSPNSAEGKMVAKAQYYSSNTNWLIMVNCTANRLGVFHRENGRWELYYFWLCSSGKGTTPTCKGVYKITSKGYAFGDGTYTCYYYSVFNGPYYIHSTKYYPGTFQDMDNRLGMNLSMGCVRIHIDNAKWIYDNVPIGSTVVTYAE